MAKSKTSYVCNNCGEIYSSWSGKCSHCGEWNSLELKEEVLSPSKAENAIKLGRELHPVKFEKVSLKPAKRITTSINDIDEVLGGGLVAGSVVLLAGQPGIGKSTLLMQLANNLAEKTNVLYVSGEESTDQIILRGKRLKTGNNLLQLATSTSANDIAATIRAGKNEIVIVDSIQTITSQDVSGIAGSISQVTNSAQILMLSAKQSGTALILVGHVNKEGSIAGPKVLEHLVDVVLQLEGDRYGGFRVLRSIKNRYGSTNEAAILEIKDDGLKIVENPSAALLAERQKCDGSVVLATLEGTRPVLVEVQALVNTTSYGYPKRAASGTDLNRLNLLIAMLERRTKLRLSDKDVYLNIVGGMKISEPAADLAICMAIASAAKGMQLKTDAVVFGEVGLSGEVRHVPWVEKRLSEAKKLGFKVAIGPKQTGGVKMEDMLFQVSDVRSALNKFLSKN